MENIIKKLYSIGIVPVVKFDDPETAVPVAKALIAGDVPCIEITFRTEHAAESIRRISEECPEMLVGAGTVLTTEQADAAFAAGAAFVVSPGLNPTVVKHCIDKNIPIMPGCSTASDVERALELGLTEVKFFPAEAAGGLNMIKALSGPFNNVRFMPTGGINLKNIKDYLAFDKIIACGGTFLVTDALVANKDWDGITKNCQEAMKAVLDIEFDHIGIKANGEEDMVSVAEELHKFTLSPKRIFGNQIFLGREFEVLKASKSGTHGHLSISTPNCDRVRFYLENKGFKFKDTSAKYDAKGKLIFAFCEGEICGFAYHIQQKGYL